MKKKILLFAFITIVALTTASTVLTIITTATYHDLYKPPVDDNTEIAMFRQSIENKNQDVETKSTVALTTDASEDGSILNTIGIDSSLERETVITTQNDLIQTAVIIPDQSYVGAWSTDENKTNEILIYEITDSSINFNTGIYKEFGFTATAIENNGVLTFGDGISPYYSGPEGIQGRLVFENDGITVIYDDFGPFTNLQNGPNTYKFTFKANDSISIINGFITTTPKELS